MATTDRRSSCEIPDELPFKVLVFKSDAIGNAVCRSFCLQSYGSHTGFFQNAFCDFTILLL